MVGPAIQGIQSTGGVIANVKHFVDNSQVRHSHWLLLSHSDRTYMLFDAVYALLCLCRAVILCAIKETARMRVSEVVGERPQFELYYPPFEAAIEAGVGSLMCSYVHDVADVLPSCRRSRSAYACWSRFTTDGGMTIGLLLLHALRNARHTDTHIQVQQNQRHLLVREPQHSAA